MNEIQKLDGILCEIRQTFGQNEKLAKSAFHLVSHAPALLDALKDLVDDCECSASPSVMDAARAAIAKAEGL